MLEDKFWDELTLRINCHKQYSMYGWCDWFEPKKYILNGISNRVLGNVGFLPGGDQNQFKFVLYLDNHFTNLNEVEWERMLPSRDKSDWLTFSGTPKLLELDPLNQKTQWMNDLALNQT